MAGGFGTAALQRLYAPLAAARTASEADIAAVMAEFRLLGDARCNRLRLDNGQQGNGKQGAAADVSDGGGADGDGAGDDSDGDAADFTEELLSGVGDGGVGGGMGGGVDGAPWLRRMAPHVHRVRLSVEHIWCGA